ncbi:uncharacterized protein LOC135497818 [Lineus longissimus]|uniref:uncharacterized protein LOC135497818 n=1 Tax=Lineus longissimus TaxID=88925 RepID=UPI00315C5BF4
MSDPAPDPNQQCTPEQLTPILGDHLTPQSSTTEPTATPECAQEPERKKAKIDVPQREPSPQPSSNNAKLEEDELHNKLMEELTRSLEALEKPKFNQIKEEFKLGSGLLLPEYKAADSAKALMDALFRKKVIRKGSYVALECALHNHCESVLVELIEDYTKKIAVAQWLRQNKATAIPHRDDRNDEIYSIPNNGTKGLLVIFNQFTSTREGTIEDENKLKRLFTDTFGFVVKSYRDKTKEEMLETISNIRKEIKRDKPAQLFLAILSHGTAEGVLTRVPHPEAALSSKLNLMKDDLNKGKDFGEIKKNLVALLDPGDELKLNESGPISSHFNDLRKFAVNYFCEKKKNLVALLDQVDELKLNESGPNSLHLNDLRTFADCQLVVKFLEQLGKIFHQLEEKTAKNSRDDTIKAFETLFDTVRKNCENDEHGIKSDAMHAFLHLREGVEKDIHKHMDHREAKNQPNKEPESKQLHKDVEAIVRLFDKHFKIIHPEAVAREFSADRSQELADKPKIFVIQACRGRLNQPSFPVQVDSDPDPETKPSDPSSLAIQPCKHRTPADVDILITYAQTKGYKALRDKTTGSWFIQELVDVFQKHFEKEHVLDMLTMVNNKVARKEPDVHRFKAFTIEQITDARQTPCLMSTLTKKLYLTCSDK